MHSSAPLPGRAAGEAIPPAERRRDQGVRDSFDDACTLLAPLFDPAQQWGKAPSQVLGLRMLRERFGHLSATELGIMLSAITKLHASGRAPARQPHS